jgi:hypothetical protein
MRNVSLLILIVTCSISSSCGSASSEKDGNQSVAFSLVTSGGQVGSGLPNNSLTSPRAFVLHSAQDCIDFWNYKGGVGISLPTIDFNQEQFIAVVDAIHGTSGPWITIMEVDSSPTGFVVKVTENIPGQGCVGIPTVAQPFTIVKSSRLPGDVTLIVNQSIISCN